MMGALPDLGLLATTSVSVRRRLDGPLDEFGAARRVWGDPHVVRGVLVSPGAPAEVWGTNRPDGVEVAFTVHFPKTWTAPLAGALVEIDGAAYRVVGDPQEWMSQNTPGPWNRAVMVERVDG